MKYYQRVPEKHGLESKVFVSANRPLDDVIYQIKSIKKVCEEKGIVAYFAYHVDLPIEYLIPLDSKEEDIAKFIDENGGDLPPKITKKPGGTK